MLPNGHLAVVMFFGLTSVAVKFYSGEPIRLIESPHISIFEP
jgi:hypothetical protein